MKVVVTGSGGFIGRAVAAQLRADGHEFVGFDRPNDVRNPDAVMQAVDGADAVIHLAGVLGTHELFDAVHLAVDVNIKGVVNVLDACVKNEARYVGITMPPAFKAIYTATKLAATALEEAYAHNYGLAVSRVRAFNAFGPGQAHGPGHPQKILPTFATYAWAGEPIPVWGDGSQTVDLVYVTDLARMLVAALDRPGQTLDGGTAKALTVNEVAEFVARCAGSDAGIEHLPMRRGEVPTRIVATGEGWSDLGWQPLFRWADVAHTTWWYNPENTHGVNSQREEVLDLPTGEAAG